MQNVNEPDLPEPEVEDPAGAVTRPSRFGIGARASVLAGMVLGSAGFAAVLAMAVDTTVSKPG